MAERGMCSCPRCNHPSYRDTGTVLGKGSKSICRVVRIVKRGLGSLACYLMGLPLVYFHIFPHFLFLLLPI